MCSFHFPSSHSFSVNISSDRRLSLRSSADQDATVRSLKTERTTFHIPQDTVKNLHITSETTVKEVIEALLKKYAVTDHPKKFALFEKTLHISDGKLIASVSLY